MDVTRLQRPVIAAPMAGGPSTPELVAAVNAAGGMGQLAAGYVTVEAVRQQIERTRSLTDRPIGVNVFVPAHPDPRIDRAAVEAYRRRLTPIALRLGADVPEPRWDDTDGFEAKIALLEEAAVDTVSFTFGCPGAQVVRRLRAVGSQVVVTVTDADEALAAVREGADALCIQGAQAGGHRSTHRVDAIPNDLSHLDLLREVRSVTSVPLVAAGGIADAQDVRRALGLGAAAVQVGTALLLTPEAGTSATHRAGLTEPSLSRSVVTRAFSGRPGRGVRNAFVDELDAYAPSVFPVVDQLTKPMRAAAAAVEDFHLVNLWAGTRWRQATAAPAAEVLERLTP
ncbi:NAD(P)H-dependent flavin oxidoreductase [Luteipulveratus flavus]|uniref:Propionate 3-nitronate monooxygenase n=1 Tax=Luteipulveratus flavus TaxID=3031728 RepID=A0ABT6C3R7_9MICO|nr:nitronate monooxygenase [Luteipulveratus sp. YIM 133296]MDF8263400.1 nitronate monooxygenase [Luteipulveratus sp. YIM 133296]